jgi:hypothetical protein
LTLFGVVLPPGFRWRRLGRTWKLYGGGRCHALRRVGRRRPFSLLTPEGVAVVMAEGDPPDFVRAYLRDLDLRRSDPLEDLVVTVTLTI